MRKTTLGRGLRALNGKQMTLGRDLRALNGKKITLGNKLEKQLQVMRSGLYMENKLLWFINEKNDFGS